MHNYSCVRFPSYSSRMWRSRKLEVYLAHEINYTYESILNEIKKHLSFIFQNEIHNFAELYKSAISQTF